MKTTHRGWLRTKHEEVFLGVSLSLSCFCDPTVSEFALEGFVPNGQACFISDFALCFPRISAELSKFRCE